MLTWRFRQIPLAPEPVIKPTGRATSNSGSSISMMVRAPIPAEMRECRGTVAPHPWRLAQPRESIQSRAVMSMRQLVRIAVHPHERKWYAKSCHDAVKAPYVDHTPFALNAGSLQNGFTRRRNAVRKTSPANHTWALDTWKPLPVIVVSLWRNVR